MGQLCLPLLSVTLLAATFAGMRVASATNQTPSTQPAATTMSSETTTASGLKIAITKPAGSDDSAARNGDTVWVHYTGRLMDGTKFDSSLDRGQPIKLTLGANMVIKGWEEGLVGTKIGEKRKLTIPPQLGYGAAGAGGVIPPNATLVFEVELVGLLRAQ